MNVNFENLSFDPFQSSNILLHEHNDPDANFFNSNDFKKINSQYVTPHEAYGELQSVDPDSFSILHLNIRSINKNFEDFRISCNH